MKNQIQNWIINQQENVEKAICHAADLFIKAKRIDSASTNILYDIAQTQAEMFNLSSGKDLCYDRYSIGMSYALWYQGRRINTSLSFCIDLFIEASKDQKPLEIFDLGAGTGAVQIAIGLCYAAAADLGFYLPTTRIINVDISPFMLEFNRSYLWKAFFGKYPILKKIKPDYFVNSWVNLLEVELQTPYIIASYLFDHEENKEAIATHFKEIIEEYQPEKLILLTSYNKRVYLDSVANEIALEGYNNAVIEKNFLLKGKMNVIGNYRAAFNEKYKPVFALNKPPAWDIYSFYARLLRKKQGSLSINTGQTTVRKGIDLYMPPIKIRKEIILNKEQKEAAKLNNAPTIITGPAGCGKSVVITERVKNLCEANKYSTHLRILVTTFNRSLITYLADWLADLLNKNRVNRKGDNFYFSDSVEPNIKLMHFDILPTRIGKIMGTLEFENRQKYDLNQAIEEIFNENASLKIKDFKDILQLDFLYDEYVRVIYGQQYDSLEKYQNGQRSNRPFSLYKNSIKRELIWKVIQKYLVNLEKANKVSIHTRRHKLLQKLRRGEHRDIFTHIFVDEFQDCTQADYQIFYGLLNDNNNLVIAGDYAQAIQLGKSADVPREDKIFQGQTKMRNRKTINLQGSYRLPFRISECITPLSKHIKTLADKEVDIITPYKGAPPGARPIVVYGSNTEEMKKKLIWIFWYYQVFDLFDSEMPRRKKITILEKDYKLSDRLNKRVEDISTTDTILRLKGMEKDCIVWSTRANIADIDDAFYYVYTILTRTCSVLIIALFDDTPKYVSEVLNAMDNEKLMIWDKETETKMKSIQRIIDFPDFMMAEVELVD